MTPSSFAWPELSGKTIVVTGGGMGVGRGVTMALARCGARIAIAGRDLARAEQAAEDARRDFGAETHALRADVSIPDACEQMIEEAARRFGEVDGLVNNAAMFALIPLLEASPEDSARMLNTNFNGALFAAQAFARRCVARKRPGAVVNISSIAGSRPAPGCGLYSASKAALNMVTKTMALEWTPLGVRVNAVAPGHVDTEGVRDDFAAGRLDRDKMMASIPARRIADVADVAEAVLFLLSDRSRHVAGATLTVDGGEAM